MTTATRNNSEQLFDYVRTHIDLWHNRHGQCKFTALTGRCSVNGAIPRKNVS